jgi:hypothetical protein
MSRHDPMYTDGAAAQFRCFRYKNKNSYLGSLAFEGWTWKPGAQEADGIPTMLHTNGLWGFKTLAEAIFQEGDNSTLIFALTKHWGKAVEHETGLRSQYAAIVAFIEPVGEEALKEFPRDYLKRRYPDVPIIHQTQINETIERLGLFTLPKATPYPLMQWSGPEEALVWGPEVVGPYTFSDGVSEYDMLPAAASFPGDLHPLDQRLRKATLLTKDGVMYCYWKLLEDPDDEFSERRTERAAEEVRQLVRWDASKMSRHRIDDPQAPERR